jgi:hypothetical protein
MIFSSTTCADFAKPFYGAIVVLFFAASGCSMVATDIERRAPLPSASADPNSSLGSTESARSLPLESDEEVRADTTPMDRP